MEQAVIRQVQEACALIPFAWLQLGLLHLALHLEQGLDLAVHTAKTKSRVLSSSHYTPTKDRRLSNTLVLAANTCSHFSLAATAFSIIFSTSPLCSLFSMATIIDVAKKYLFQNYFTSLIQYHTLILHNTLYANILGAYLFP